MRKLLLAAVAAPIAALFAAAPSHADQYDYVSQLDNAGVYYSNILDVIDTGKADCSYLRRGVDPGVLMTGLQRLGYAPVEAGQILVSAAVNMCPDTLPALRAYAQPSPVV